jgi:hypothetical protein
MTRKEVRLPFKKDAVLATGFLKRKYPRALSALLLYLVKYGSTLI